MQKYVCYIHVTRGQRREREREREGESKGDDCLGNSVRRITVSAHAMLERTVC